MSNDSVKKYRENNYCNGCRENIACFIIKEYIKFMRIKKIYTLQGYTAEDHHFMPQNW